MEIEELKQLLVESWDKDTCSPGLREEWNEENPSIGQCAITALIVNDYFGGKIMRCMAYNGSHYYNMIDDELIDLTVEQFLGRIPDYEHGEERTREYLLGNEDTKSRYMQLKDNLQKVLDETEVVRRNRYRRCVNQRMQFMSDEVSKEFRDLLQMCTNQLYLDENGIVLQKKKKI